MGKLNVEVPIVYQQIEMTEDTYLSAAKRALALSDQAVRGPWKGDPYHRYIWGPDMFMVSDQTPLMDAALFSVRGWSDLTGHDRPYQYDHKAAVQIQKANADLISEYRTLAPDLANAVLQLHDRIKELEALVETISKSE